MQDIFLASGHFFERAGVAISASGDAALMVGPESRYFAADRSKIEKIFYFKGI